MDNGYVINTKYNSNTYLYDVTIMLDNNDTKTINCYRLLNNTSLVYKKEPGYFYISTDNKYLFIKDTSDITDILKNIQFISINPLKTNQDLLEINNDPLLKYTYIVNLTIFDTNCINLALEDYSRDRINQIKNAGKLNSYDCLITNSITEKYDEFKLKNDSIYERLSQLFTPSSPSSTSPDVIQEINIVDIHTYNKFYVYGLTTLNMLLIIIVILMIIVLSNDTDIKKTNSRRR
jgi:hypothetical protein